MINEYFMKNDRKIAVPFGYRDKITLKIDDDFNEEEYLKDSSDSDEHE